ncbi:putative GTPase [Rubidibacter lacunae KORDI 51-2]|uniref:Putative GTPase n=1 Tax=Rubidibacter lacunae KORDI 51-2 TaxID=582515 RepID=U5DAN2_9CHRO|nr:TIR domain-containing protein [Rubidibacter lacunae]ERN41593.1 putative GTPase [Rubidibacter lacunae KORDI 51-2]
MRVFVSYSSSDQSHVNDVEQVLKTVGVEYFLDKRDMHWGDDISARIVTEILSSDALLVLVSQSSLKSPWVQFEIGAASGMDKQILPFLAEGDLDVPDYIRQYHYATNLDDIAKYFSDLKDDESNSDGWTEEQFSRFQEIKEQIKFTDKWRFTFLMTGRTGVGKSSTINSLMGEEVSPRGRYKRTTTNVLCHEGIIDEVPYTIYDSPGLADTDKSKQTDYSYLRQIQRVVKKIDCMLFVTKLNDTRPEQGDLKTIRRITKYFGADIWKHAVIVLTFADKVHPKLFQETYNNRSNLIRAAINNNTEGKYAADIPFVAAANDEISGQPIPLPDGNIWLGELYTEVFCRIKEENAAPFFFATLKRLKKKNKKHGSNRRDSNNNIEIDKNQGKRIGDHFSSASEAWEATKKLGRTIYQGFLSFFTGE